MRTAEIDAWVQRIASETAAGRQSEDARVELKKTWPSAEDAAWRIAGHANAAGGEPILWVIGLAPDGSVADLEANELANWWPQVCKYFDDGVAPIMRDVVVHLPTGAVVALLFDTEAAPFVVKGGRHNFEVPFREGTRTDGARRRHLTRLLAPTAVAPLLDILGFELVVFQTGTTESPAFGWRFEISLFVTPVGRRPPHLYFDRIHPVVRHMETGKSVTFMNQVHFEATEGAVVSDEAEALVTVREPSFISVLGDAYVPKDTLPDDGLEFELRLARIGDATPLIVQVLLQSTNVDPRTDTVRRWVIA